MNITDITTWSVSKGIAKPNNPYQKRQIPFRKRYIEFEKFAQQHMFATDAPDGYYPTNYFGEFLPFIDQVKAESPKFGEWISVEQAADEYVNQFFLTKPADKADLRTAYCNGAYAVLTGKIKLS